MTADVTAQTHKPGTGKSLPQNEANKTAIFVQCLFLQLYLFHFKMACKSVRSFVCSFVRSLALSFIRSFCTCHVEAIFFSASSRSDINMFFSRQLKKGKSYISEILNSVISKKKGFLLQK